MKTRKLIPHYIQQSGQALTRPLTRTHDFSVSSKDTPPLQNSQCDLAFISSIPFITIITPPSFHPYSQPARSSSQNPTMEL